MEEMDFHSMKRNELQALCKKHKIRANIKTLEMVNKLTQLFKKNEMLSTGGEMKMNDGDASEIESNVIVVNKVVKKVRFSPENQMFEFTRSPKVRRRNTRNSSLGRDSRLSIENVDSAELQSENVGYATELKMVKKRVRRSENTRVQKRLKGEDRSDNEASVNMDDDNVIQEIVNVGRVTRTRREKMAETVMKGDGRGKKVVESNSNVQVLVNAENGEDGVFNRRRSLRKRRVLDEGSLESGLGLNVNDNQKEKRVTRLGRQRIAEIATKDKREGEKVAESNSNVQFLVSAENGEDGAVNRRRTLRKRGVVSEGSLESGLGLNVNDNEKRVDEVLDNQKIVQEDNNVEPMLLRRLNRNANNVLNSETLVDDAKIQENGGRWGLRGHRKSLAVEGSKLDVEGTGTGGNVETDGIVEGAKVELRRSRRKSVMPSNLGTFEFKANNEGSNVVRSSVLEVEAVGGDSKEDKKVPEAVGILRNSRRHTLILKSASTDEKLEMGAVLGQEIHTTQKNTRRSKRNASSDNKPLASLDELPGDAIIHQKNEHTKRKMAQIPKEDVVIGDLGRLTRSIGKTRRNEKAVNEYALTSVYEESKPLSTVKESNLIEASPQESLVACTESFAAELSVPRVAESTRTSVLIRNTSAKSISSEMNRAFTRKSNRMVHEDSVIDTVGNLDISCLKELSEMAVEKVNLSPEVDVNELTEESNSATDKNEIAAQVFCHNVTESKELQEAFNVSVNADAETCSSADTLVFGDQTDFRTELELKEAEAVNTQPADLVHFVGEVNVSSVQESFDHVEPLSINDMKFPIEYNYGEVNLLEASNKISDHKNETNAGKFGESVDFKPFGDEIISTDFMSDLELDVQSSGKPRGLEDEYIAESGETYEALHSGSAELEKERCLENVKDISDDDGNFSLSNLFDYERIAGITPKDKGVNDDERGILNFFETKLGVFESDDKPEVEETCVHKNFFDDQIMIFGSPVVAPTTMPVNSTEIIYSADYLGTGPETSQIIGKEVGVAEIIEETIETSQRNMQRDKISINNTSRNGERGTSNLADESSNEGTYEAEQPKSPCIVTIHTASASSVGVKESWSCANKIEGNAMSTIKTNSRQVENTSQAVEIIDNGEHGDEIIFTNSAGDLELNAPSSGKLRGLEDEYITKTDETYVDTHLGLAELNKDGCLDDYQEPSMDDENLGLPNLLHCERSAGMTPKERGISDVEQRTFLDSLAVSPPTMHADCSEVKLSVFEADEKAEVEETCLDKAVHSELAETEKCGYLMVKMGMLTLSDPFTGEEHARNALPRIIVSCEYSNKDSEEQEMFHASPAIAPATMHVNFTEINLSADSFITGFEMCQTIGKESGVAETIEETEVKTFQSDIPANEVSMQNTIRNREHETFNQTGESSNEVTYEPEQLKSPSIVTTDTANSVQVESWSCLNKTEGNAMFPFKTLSKGEIFTQAINVSNSGEDENQLNTYIAAAASNGNSGLEKEDFVDEWLPDLAIRMNGSNSKVRFESLSEEKFQDIKAFANQFQNLFACNMVANVDEELSGVDSENELNNQCGTPKDTFTLAESNEASCRTELLNVITSVNKSITTNHSCSFTKTKQHKLDEEGGSETEKAVIESLIWTSCQEAFVLGGLIGKEENELQLLTTTIKCESSLKVDRISDSYKKSENISGSKVFCTMKDELVTQTGSQGKIDGERGKEHENINQEVSPTSFSVEKEEDELQLQLVIGVTDATCKVNATPVSETKSENTPSDKMVEESGDEFVNSNVENLVKGVHEVSEEKWSEKMCEQMEQTGTISEKNTLSLENIFLDEVETDIGSESTETKYIMTEQYKCHEKLLETDLSKNLIDGSEVEPECKMAESSGEAFGLCDPGTISKDKVPENNHDIAANTEDSYILTNTVFSKPRGPELANFSSIYGDIDAEVDKGKQSNLLHKASHERKEVTEMMDMVFAVDSENYDGANIRDLTDDYPRSSQKIHDEKLQTSSKQKVTQETDMLPSNDEIEKQENMLTSNEENWTDVVPAAGNTLSGYTESNLFSNLEMHLLTVENEKDIEKSEGPYNYNLEGAHKNDGKVIEEISSTVTVKQQILDFGNCVIPSISDTPASVTEEALKESDVIETIQEYIDSESSISVGFDESGANFPSETSTHFEESKNNKNEELNQEMLFMEPLPAPASKTEMQDCEEIGSKSVSGQFSTAKKNQRTILIHGTPDKKPLAHIMKENMPQNKISQIGDFTCRPPKRKALQDVQIKK